MTPARSTIRPALAPGDAVRRGQARRVAAHPARPRPGVDGQHWHTGSVFEGFKTDQIDVAEASVYVRHGGDGPPVVLLHGHPRTSATWHRVAPQLVQRGFTVVCPDLRGYGRSRGPAPTSDHAAHSKRATAKDVTLVMHALGHPRFGLAGHDRGSYVAFR